MYVGPPGCEVWNRIFAGITTRWQGSSPIFLILIDLFVSRDQNNKDGRHFGKSTHLSDRNKHFASLKRYSVAKTVVAEPELSTRFVWESGLIPRDQSH